MGRRPGVRKSRHKVQFEKLRKCRCFHEVETRLRAGVACARVARFIHDQNEMQDVGTDSLTHMLRDFRDTMRGLGVGLMHQRMPEKAADAVEEVERSINEIKELVSLYDIQKERIEIDFKNERALRKLFKTTGGEVLIAAKTLQMIAQIKADQGLVKRELGHLTIDETLSAEYIEKVGSEAVQAVIQNPERRQKVLNLVNRLAEAQRKQIRVLDGGKTGTDDEDKD